MIILEAGRAESPAFKDDKREKRPEIGTSTPCGIYRKDTYWGPTPMSNEEKVHLPKGERLACWASPGGV